MHTYQRRGRIPRKRQTFEGDGFVVCSFCPRPYDFAPQSIGAKATNELAVLVDSFRPLRVAKAALAIEDPGYPLSWISR